jgi:hypothetical protein
MILEDWLQYPRRVLTRTMMRAICKSEMLPLSIREAGFGIGKHFPAEENLLPKVPSKQYEFHTWEEGHE